MEAKRNRIFIGHANPEDNVFARWLTLRLAAEGYPVWCDITEMSGGEPFWSLIEREIRDETVKYVFVLSKVSNAKEGVRRELGLADTIGKRLGDRDFIIPVRIDDIPFSEQNIITHERNTIDCEKSWAKGLARLLEKLEKDKVEKNEAFGPAWVRDWWRRGFESEKHLLHQEEVHSSNWFRVLELPERIHFHEVAGHDALSLCAGGSLAWPAYPHLNRLVTFASAGEVFKARSANYRLESRTAKVRDLLNDRPPSWLDRRDGRRLLSWLLSDSWQKEVMSRGLLKYSLAGRRTCLCFPQNLLEDDWGSFTNASGRKARRALVGYKTLHRPDGTSSLRIWHYAIQANPRFYPEVHFCIKSHLVFSDDGKTPWESHSRSHSARRSQSKGWWNDRWRDLLLAAMGSLGQPNNEVVIGTGGDHPIRIKATPETFVSPVRFAAEDVEVPISGEEIDHEDALSESADAGEDE